MSARLVIAATPIGNIGDASPRLREVLAQADIIAAEDTRRLLNLMKALGVTTHARVVAYHDFVEADRAPALVHDIQQGRVVVLVSDAGMPMVSDPGYRLVNAALDAGVLVDVIPGPSAVLAALAVSGLPNDRFSFEGFLPRKAGERASRLAELSGDRRTMIFFEAPHRGQEALTAMRDAFNGDRRVAVCRELTKTFQEVIRGSVDDVLAKIVEQPLRGEVTIVVEGFTGTTARSDAQIVQMVRDEQEGGAARNAAVADVAKRLGMPRQHVYDLVLAAKSSAGPQ